MPANTSISVSWETKHRLEAIVAEMTAERAERQERGRKVSMDDAVTPAANDQLAAASAYRDALKASYP